MPRQLTQPSRRGHRGSAARAPAPRTFFSSVPPLTLGLPPPPHTSRRAAERRRASAFSAPPLPPCPRAVSLLIAAPPPSVVPGRRASPSPATRVRREEEPQRVDSGEAASIPREKGEGAGFSFSPTVRRARSFLPFLRPWLDQVFPLLRRSRSILPFLHRAWGSTESDAPH